jgi:hypothetical protein
MQKHGETSNAYNNLVVNGGDGDKSIVAEKLTALE